jgi:hypothetical protein
MLGREVEERPQCFAVLRQAVDRLVMFRPCTDSATLFNTFAVLCNPAALMRRSGKDLVERLACVWHFFGLNRIE